MIKLQSTMTNLKFRTDLNGVRVDKRGVSVDVIDFLFP